MKPAILTAIFCCFVFISCKDKDKKENFDTYVAHDAQNMISQFYHLDSNQLAVTHRIKIDAELLEDFLESHKSKYIYLTFAANTNLSAIEYAKNNKIDSSFIPSLFKAPTILLTNKIDTPATGSTWYSLMIICPPPPNCDSSL